MGAGGQTQVTYTYDNANRLTNLANGTNVTISYDDDGRRTGLALPNGVAVAYGYDTDSRLTSVTYSSTGGGTLGNLTYSYDQAGRRVGMGGSLAAVKLPTAASASYSAGNQVTMWNATATNPDQANNLALDPTLPTPGTLTWDERNQVKKVEAGGLRNYYYDAFGRRENATASGVTSSFLYDRVAPVRTTAGTTITDLLAFPGSGEVFSRKESTTTMVPLHDGLGSTIALVDSTGHIVTQYSYEPFGDSTTTGTANSNPFKFAGMEADTSGLYHTWARYYSPGLQRFVSEDPLGLAGGDTNIFSYVHNNPVNMVDPLGLSGSASATGAGGGDGKQREAQIPIGRPSGALVIQQQRSDEVPLAPGKVTVEQHDAFVYQMSVWASAGFVIGALVVQPIAEGVDAVDPGAGLKVTMIGGFAGAGVMVVIDGFAYFGFASGTGIAPTSSQDLNMPNESPTDFIPDDSTSGEIP
jgi:RHS repeat-associated protein